MIFGATWVRALVVLAIVAGCSTTSGGGSQTNWVACKTDGECTTQRCVHGFCQSPSDSKDAGTASVTEKDSSATSMKATSAPASGELGAWASTADSPLAANDCVGSPPAQYCAEQTCVAGSKYVYCVGANSTSTYYSELSSAGLGSWIRGADYPIAVKRTSCVVGSDDIYCVGGDVPAADGGAPKPVANAYYAHITSPGVGKWTVSTPFPHATDEAQCMTNSGYLYCVASSVGNTRMPEAYFAPVSSSGIGAWTQTAAPPISTSNCFAIDGYAYCLGIGNCPPAGPNSDCYSPTFYAPLGAQGIGTWKKTSEIPAAVSAVSASAGSYIYYFSIPVFYASVSADGIGPWKTTTNYPDSSYPAGCVSSGGYLYCGSQTANGSYFAQLGASNPRALHLENPPPFPRSEYLGPAWLNGGGCMVSSNGVSAGAPCFTKNIDEAVVFDCASQAKTAAGCKTTVVSSNTAYNFDVTIWYPCPNDPGADANCCFLPAVGYDKPFDGWCSSTSSESFIISDKMTLRESQ
jgi:hypothetical protein